MSKADDGEGKDWDGSKGGRSSEANGEVVRALVMVDIEEGLLFSLMEKEGV